MAHSAATNKVWTSLIGQRVFVKNKTFGILKYVGEIKFKRGIWCGIELDEPVGETNGMINTVQYFTCEVAYGTFSPVCEITVIKKSTTETSSVCELLKIKCSECKRDSTSPKKRNSRQKLKQSSKLSNSDKLDLRDGNYKKEARLPCKTYNLNENKDTKAVFNSQTQREKINKQHDMDITIKNNLKKSRNSCGRLKTEESLGIISDLLVDDESWNLLDPITDTEVDNCLIDESLGDNDTVFYPSVKTPSRSSFYAEHVDSPIQNCLNVKCSSTPKNFFNNVIDLDKTVKLNDKQFDILCDEIEPIIADSCSLKFKNDFDVANFEENDILCSTSKFSVLPLSSQFPMSGDVPLDKNAEYNNVIVLNEVKKPTISTVSNVCVNIEPCDDIYTDGKIQNLNPLNLTYEIIPGEFGSPIANNLTISKDASTHSNSEYDQKPDEVINMNSTFVMPNNFQEVSEGERTFIIDQSPVNTDKILSLESNAISKKNMLSPIFETSSNSTSVFFARKSEKPSNTTSNINSGGTSELLVEPIKSFLPRIDEENNVALELNSTFYIGNRNVETISRQDPKRCSLPAAFIKKGIYGKKDKLGINSLKLNMQKSSTQVQLPVTVNKKCLQSSISCPTSTSILKQSKNIQAKFSNVPNVGLTTKKSFEIPLKNKRETTCSLLESSYSIANKTKQHKDLVITKSKVILSKQGTDSPNSLFTNKENKKCITSRKSVSNYSNKVIPKLSFNNKKIDNSETNLNPKDTGCSISYGLKLNSPSSVKLSKKKQRHSMLPTLHAKATSSKENVSEVRSDVTCIVNAVKSSFVFNNNKNVTASKIHQHEIGKVGRKSMLAPSAEASEKKLSKTYDKKIENFKSKLLKPGALSRLPAPEKSTKLGANSGIVESQTKLGMKTHNIIGLGDKRISRKSSLKK